MIPDDHAKKAVRFLVKPVARPNETFLLSMSKDYSVLAFHVESIKMKVFAIEPQQKCIIASSELAAASARVAAVSVGQPYKDIEATLTEAQAQEMQAYNAQLAILNDCNAVVVEILEVMNRFYLDHSTQNGQAVLVALEGRLRKLRKIKLLTNDSDLLSLINNIINDCDSLYAVARVKIPKFVAITEGKLGLYGRTGKRVVSALAEALYKNRLVREHLLIKFDQTKVPIIYVDKGWCYGIGLALSHELLSNANVTQFKTIEQLESNTVDKLAEIHASYCSHDAQEFLDNESTKRWREQTEPFSHVFVDNFDGSRLSSTDFARHIAADVAKVIGKVQEESYALAISLLGIHKDSDGHAMSVVRTPQGIFFIDANSGIYSFKDVAALQNFLEFYLPQKHYTLEYNNFSLINYPQLEHDFPIPEGLKPLKVRSLLSNRSDDSKSAYLWDTICGVRAKVTAVYEATRVEASSLFSLTPRM